MCLGMDFFEEYYLLFDSAAALLGSPFHYKQLLYSVLIEEVPPEEAFTVIFNDFVDEVTNSTPLNHVPTPLSIEMSFSYCCC